MDSPTFRQTFPEFGNPAAYNDSQINFWLNIASQMVDANVWGTMAAYGISLFVAHNLVLSSKNQRAGRNGAAAASSGGVISSKSIDKLAISYDTKVGTLEDGGAWNLTDYGIRFAQLVNQFGGGGVQLGSGCMVNNSSNPDSIAPYWY